MGGLDAIAIKVVATDAAATGNLRPLLYKIRHALSRLLATGESSAIDLAGLPLAPGEERELLDFLGEGEIELKLDALGPSIIRETRYAGVWLVVHRNLDSQLMAKFIEVTFAPEILKSPAAEVRLALERLQARLEPAGRP